MLSNIFPFRVRYVCITSPIQNLREVSSSSRNAATNESCCICSDDEAHCLQLPLLLWFYYQLRKLIKIHGHCETSSHCSKQPWKFYHIRCQVPMELRGPITIKFVSESLKTINVWTYIDVSVLRRYPCRDVVCGLWWFQVLQRYIFSSWKYLETGRGLVDLTRYDVSPSDLFTSTDSVDDLRITFTLVIFYMLQKTSK